VETPSRQIGRYSGVSALVLGASGFIGGWVVRALAAQGASVRAVVRDPATAPALRDLSSSGVTVADLARPRVITEIVRAARPSIVFNLAGYGVDQSERDSEAMALLNSRLVAELCETLALLPSPGWAGLRLVHVGSALEYGFVSGPLTADTTLNPTTAYGRTKLAGTRHVSHAGAALGLRAAVARLFTVYGPGEQSGRLLPSLLDAARTTARIPLTSGKQRRDFTHVEDVVEGLLRMGVSEAPPGIVVNLATGELTSVRVFAETAAAVFGLGLERLDFGAVPVRGEEMFHGEVDVTPLERLLSWRPSISVADGLRRAWEHERVE